MQQRLSILAIPGPRHGADSTLDRRGSTMTIVVATRIHLGKSQDPPADLEEKIELFAQFCYDRRGEEDGRDVACAAAGAASSSPHRALRGSSSSDQNDSNDSNNNSQPAKQQESVRPSDIVGVIAVDAEQRIAGYDLVESVRQLCAEAAASDSFTAADPDGRREIHVLPVQPWGNFTPALNALILWAGEETQSASQILFVSAETTAAPLEATLAVLQSHLAEDTLVVGAVLPGHDHHVPDGIGTSQRSVSRELSGRTTPWNTLALWDLAKLSLTGFQLVSDGLGDSAKMGGVEEAAVIALQQSLFPGQRKAKLVPVDGIRWEQDFTDPARREWHEHKMQSKVERAAFQLERLRLKNGTVEHFAPMNRTAGGNRLQFVVTGFGPFDTIAVNPTEMICRNLGSHWQPSNSELRPRLVRSEIIETSAEAAQQTLADIFLQCDRFLSTIVIHLGLNKNATCFHLEQCAYNEADFRVPDQRGYQPHREPVVSDRPIGDSIATTLAVQLLAERMTEAFPKAGTVVSQDPGRFVCNYTYYRSLLLAQDRPNTTSLFVHIPDLTSLSIDECIIYMEGLFEQLQSLSETTSTSD
jgi:pyrrolidone-carboxylate peptidase